MSLALSQETSSVGHEKKIEAGGPPTFPISFKSHHTEGRSQGALAMTMCLSLTTRNYGAWTGCRLFSVGLGNDLESTRHRKMIRFVFLPSAFGKQCPLWEMSEM